MFIRAVVITHTFPIGTSEEQGKTQIMCTCFTPVSRAIRSYIYGTAQFKLHTRVCISRVYLVTPVEHF